MGNQEVQASEGMWGLQDHLADQERMGNQGRMEDQEKKVRRVQMVLEVPRGAQALRGTAERPDPKECRLQLRHLETLENLENQVPLGSLVLKGRWVSRGPKGSKESMADLEVLDHKDFLEMLAEMERGVPLDHVVSLGTKGTSEGQVLKGSEAAQAHVGSLVCLETQVLGALKVLKGNEVHPVLDLKDFLERRDSEDLLVFRV